MSDDIQDDFDEELKDLEDDSGDNEGLIEALETAQLAPDIPVYYLRLACSSETFYAIYKGDPLPPRTQVVVPTRYGRDLAQVIRQVKNETCRDFSRVTRIDRPASAEDLGRARNNARLETRAFSVCREMIKGHELDMKLLAAHYLLEEPKIVFFYTAERRVDFRGLLKDLISYFKARIELRQIGFREDPRMTGGIGICGRPFCCHSVFDRPKSATIKMAKAQKLSLNTIKISGQCEKLLCCLSYENDFYVEQLAFMPYEGARLSYEGEMWSVSEVNAVLGMVTLEAEDGRKAFLPKTRFEKNDGRWRIKPEAGAAGGKSPVGALLGKGLAALKGAAETVKGSGGRHR